MAFKIDVEIARYVGDDKIIDDSGNLSREGKDIMDSFIDNNCHTLFSWMLQIEGSSISFSTLYPTAPGLYAHLPLFRNSLPSNINELENNVPELLTNLLTFRVRANKALRIYTYIATNLFLI